MGATTYTDEQRQEAVALADEVGPTEAARRLDIPKRTLSSWREPAQADAEKTATARAVGAERVATEWADYRSKEAIAAGATANRLRQEIRTRVENGVDGKDLQAIATAYGILIDKAEKLSNQATERIEVWAESEVDRELREAITELEARVREGG